MSISVITGEKYRPKLHELIQLVESGEEVFTTKSSKFTLTFQNTPPKKQQFKQLIPNKPRRLGLLDGKITIPDNFNTLMAEEISMLFGDM